MAYVIPKAWRLFIEIANVLKEREGFDEYLLAEVLMRSELVSRGSEAVFVHRFMRYRCLAGPLP